MKLRRKEEENRNNEKLKLTYMKTETWYKIDYFFINNGTPKGLIGIFESLID